MPTKTKDVGKQKKNSITRYNYSKRKIALDYLKMQYILMQNNGAYTSDLFGF